MINDYTYCFPEDFKIKLVIYSEQRSKILSNSLKKCSFKHTDVGLAFYAGVKGDNWGKHAIDLNIYCSTTEKNLLHQQKKLLKEVIGIALDPNETDLIIRNIYYLEGKRSIFPRTDDERLRKDIEVADLILEDIVNIANQLCVNVLYDTSLQENSLNDYLRDMLSSKGYYELKDQTRHGASRSGRGAGEVDILIAKNGQEKALIEGLKLNSFNTSYINSHIEKAIGAYNPLGVATFIIAYINTNNFSDFWEKYYRHISSYQFTEKLVLSNTELEEKPQISAVIKIAHKVITKDGYKMPLYFIAIKLSKGSK